MRRPRRRLIEALLALPLALLLARHGMAASGCRPERLAALPIVLLHDIPLVTMTIDGHAVSLILDTGAEQTILSAAAAKQLGLALHFEYPHALRGLASTLTDGQAELRSLSFAGLSLHPYPVRVGAIALPALEGGTPGGLLGADILAAFDLDLDIAARRLTLYRRQSCADAKPAWAPPYADLAANRSLNDHLFFYVRLDGRRLAAFIDSGSQGSVIDSAAAAALGVGPGALERDRVAPTRGVGAHVVPARLHRFARLELAGESGREPVFAVTRLGLHDADLILGMNWLRTHRVWLSYGSPAVFVKGGS